MREKRNKRNKRNVELFQFPEVDLLYKTDHVFENLVYDRKTEVYKDALVWAELILTQHLPNLIHGEKKLIALVFDMNKLWEEYLYSILKKEESVSQIHFNSEKVFWLSRISKSKSSLNSAL